MTKIPPKIFEIPIEGWNFDELCTQIDSTQQPFWIVTANPEILLEARRDPGYAKIIQQADARIVDGFGLWIACAVRGRLVPRMTGVELGECLLKEAAEKQWRVALLGGGHPDTAEEAREKIQQKYPGLLLHVEYGGRFDREGNMDDQGESALDRLMLFSPELLFVAIGHPKQDFWIAKHLADFPQLKVVTGVGGAIDFWAGVIQRAPKIFQRLGLEWVWRLMQEPRRLKRILRAVIVFPLLFIFDLFKFKKILR
ncbi:WecB/TagA/CpsF family glycosyltransferase [Candidatus Uhrbacteria bacterium]|nr:WecB/TagA/CpsF family glycosyltransferase [Candidatus Uhrbacteria bacterium]